MDELIHELRSYAHQRFFDGSEKYDQHILYLADQIEEEMANYVELPKDADGVTIRIGDEVEYGHYVGAVDRLLLNESDEPRVGTTFGGYFYGKELHHAKPDSWERIIRDAQGDGILNQIDGRPSDFEALVERCKRLAGEDA